MIITERQLRAAIREELRLRHETQLNESAEVLEFIQLVSKFLVEHFGIEGLVFLGLVGWDLVDWVKANFSGDETPEEIEEKVKSPEVGQEIEQAKSRAASVDFDIQSPTVQEQLIRLLEKAPEAQTLQSTGEKGVGTAGKEYAIHKGAKELGKRIVAKGALGTGARTLAKWIPPVALSAALYDVTDFAADQVDENPSIYIPGYREHPTLRSQPGAGKDDFVKDLEDSGTIPGVGPYGPDAAIPHRPSTDLLVRLANQGDKKAQKSLTHPPSDSFLSASPKPKPPEKQPMTSAEQTALAQHPMFKTTSRARTTPPKPTQDLELKTSQQLHDFGQEYESAIKAQENEGIRGMKINGTQLRKIIEEELDRRVPISEGYMVPRFTNTASMENWIEELDPDDQVEQDVVDPETGELVIPAGETPRDQDWWEDVVDDDDPEEPAEFDWKAYEAEMEAKEEQERVEDERIQDMLRANATAAGEDWAADTYHDAKNNPGMWKDYHGVETAEDYVEAFAQDAAGDIADSLLKYSSEPKVATWYESLPDRERLYSSRPTKSVMRDILADYFYDGVGRTISKVRG